MFKIDMHCHTAEGSLDAFVGINEIIEQLRKKGFDGVLITDHNSYKGFNKISEKKYDNFKIFKGMEYDTFDVGHVLIILPEGKTCNEIKITGLPLNLVSKFVHNCGGIIGLAHPFGHGAFGAFKHRGNRKKMESILKSIDFIEVFNSSASTKGNRKALTLAKEYNIPITGGSDSHRKNCIGIAGCMLDTDKIENNDDLINIIKEYKTSYCFGEYTQKHLVKLKQACFVILSIPYYYGRKAAALRH